MGSHSRRTGKGAKTSKSKVVAAVRARKEHGGTAAAIHAADPDTIRGLAARQAGVAAIGTWRHRHELAPVTATVLTLAAGSAFPALTAAGMLAAAGGQELARRTGWGRWSAEERVSATGWAITAAGWAGAHLLVPGGPWWAWVASLTTTTSVHSVLYWRAGRAGAQEPVEAEISIYERALAAVLGELSMDGGPLIGAQLIGLETPAPQVVVATIALGYGAHADDTATSALARAIESRAQIPFRGGIEVAALSPTTIQITASWSQALDSGAVTWQPGRAGRGQSWMGVDDARQDILVSNYTRGAVDGKTRVHHGWLVGRTGAGKSSAATDLVLPGLAASEELLLIADGKGDSMDRVEKYACRYARRVLTGGLPGDRFEQVITLAWAIMMARKARPGGWTGPSPTDPVITLLINEATSVKASIDATTQEMVAEIGRMGESLGVRSIQDLQIPKVDDLIGEGGWRANTRWVFGFVSADATYSSIAAQSTNDEVSLLGLAVGRAAVIVEGQVVARKAKMVWISEDDVAQAMRGVEPAQLHPDDMAAVQPLWDLTGGWAEQDAANAAQPIELSARDLRLHRWARPTSLPAGAGLPLAGTTNPLAAIAMPAGPTALARAEDDDVMGCDDMAIGGGRLHLVPAQSAPLTLDRPIPDRSGDVLVPAAATARDWAISFLARHGPASAAAMLPHAPYSRSTLFEALKTLTQQEDITKQGDTYMLTAHIGSAAQ